MGRLEIYLDSSGKTYGFNLYHGDEEIMSADGFESEEEIKEYLKKFRRALSQVL